MPINLNEIRSNHDELKHLLANTGFHVSAINVDKGSLTVENRDFFNKSLKMRFPL